MPLVSLLGACVSAQPFAGMTADELFTLGESAVQDEDWSAARDAFEQYLISFPRLPNIVQARLHLASAYYGRGEFITAASEYNRTIDRYPGDSLISLAALGVCESNWALSPIPQRDQTFTLTAVETCERVVRDFPGTEQSSRATELRGEMVHKLAERLYQEGDFYYGRGLYDSAIISYQTVFELFPDTSVAPRALLRMWQAYQKIGYEDDEEDTRQRLLRLYPDSPEAQSLSSGA